ncbi:MAG TPA: hypothetical protein VH083_10520 [Myxococcales bacterium]|jgi:hypothetical protein|nr:hypothetical protein [Myxococcales bacterium]
MKTICSKAILIAAILMVGTASRATPQGPDTDASTTTVQPKPAAAKKKPAKATPEKTVSKSGEDKALLAGMCNFCHQQTTQDECVGPNSGACTYPPCGAPTPTNGTADESKPRLVCYACSELMKKCDDLAKKH